MFTKNVPVWILVLVLLAGMAAGIFVYIQTQAKEYSFTIPAGTGGDVAFEYGPTPALANADYYGRVHQTFVDQKVTFVEADLSQMKIRVYKEGALATELDIKTKGREGSWWETPAGLYKIEAKETNHFSSIGKVYQPWSMVFQGNFFIHGWPYEPDGTPVASTYSGGCIRLTTDDAKVIYDLVSVGTPVLVYEKDFAPDGFAYPVKSPEVAAEKYLIADIRNNTVIASKGITDPMPIASVTKLVTSLVGAEYIDLDKNITISSDMIVPTSKSRLYAGQKVSVYNLLFPLLTESSNEAAEAIARSLGRGRFVKLMNQKAKSINMMHTSFVDPSGSGDGNISTAEDLFALAKYIYNNRSFVFNISSGKIAPNAYGDTIFTDLQNFNTIPGVTAKFVGGKIGKTTAAQETYMGVFNETIGGESRPIVVILLHSPDVYADARNALIYVESTYK